MSDQVFLVLLIIMGVLSLAYGVWAGLGYPGRYEKYERTGSVPRGSPFQMAIDWIFDRLSRKQRP